MKRLKILLFIGFLCSLIACSPTNPPLPTRVPTAAVPPTQTPLPVPTPTFSTHTSLESLVKLVVGDRLKHLAIDSVESDGLIGHDIDITVYQPHERSRIEMLEMAYSLAHEYYYNYPDSDGTYITLHLRAGIDDDPPDLLNCSFGLGVGYKSAPRYIPTSRPDNIEFWYSRFVITRYYGDEPNQTYDQIVYGNDPTSQTFCGVEEWKK
jgi:hypothetical protein